MKILAKRLIELRTEMGLSQRALADKLGLSHSAINRWEDESRVPNAEAVVILAKFFNVTSDYLLGLED